MNWMSVEGQRHVLLHATVHEPPALYLPCPHADDRDKLTVDQRRPEGIEARAELLDPSRFVVRKLLKDEYLLIVFDPPDHRHGIEVAVVPRAAFDNERARRAA